MGLLKGDGVQPGSTNISQATSGGFNAILDRGSEFEGKLTFEGTVRIDGKFKGEIVSDATLVVGESGKVDADVNIGSISISGEVNGNIKAQKRVEIHAPATVRGNIETPVIIIEEGVFFEGQCQMTKGADMNRSNAKPKLEPVASPMKKEGEARP